jgi:hypothetical protein
LHSRFSWKPASGHTWLRWNIDADCNAKYRDYADMLHWYQSQTPDKRLIPKAPDYVDRMDVLLRAVSERHDRPPPPRPGRAIR